ncbi:serine/threonine protein kinase [Vulcanisaeta distributa]|uniref:non-specific serine/threonine protein kinase n=1 Tax=Vulcanisaeta distributa (strain DSM 14429 / JCM 11212 / NBRC 100878 / IC-017) TaxID=572478 RepID=E1QUP6_VULDI|nr:serine/threonine-protein kinase [Vulcanisaeta distributa]ADN51165.1 serine/threonine protein kinase [Vulcanisaeta distributa DSM 14429]
MLITDVNKVLKALPGIVLFISLLFITGVNAVRALIVVSLFVLFYELFRKYPLRNNWFLIPLISEIILALSMIFIMSNTYVYDVLAVFLGVIVLVLSLRVADLRAMIVLISLYVLYLFYRGYVNPAPPALYLLINSLLIFVSSFIITIRGSILMYRIDFPEDVIDRAITYLGVLLIVPAAVFLLVLNQPYAYMALMPSIISAVPMMRKFPSYVSAAVLLVTLVYGIYPVVRIYWLGITALTLIFIIMYLRPTRLRFVRGLKPPLSWLGAWLDGKYLIDDVIATGGFSYVLRGRDEWGRVYAIKVLKDRDSRGNPLANDPRVLSSFKKEMSEYLFIESPHIVRVFEVHIPPDEELPYKSLEDYLSEPPYVVMEFMEGGSLRDLMKEKGPLELSEFLRLAYSITLALSELHKANIIHLDLKPENILFKDRERRIVKIGDLGAAKIMVGGKSYVSQFSIAYAAPEVSKGIADVRSDIYSLSCIFYEMLTGINPHIHRLSSGQAFVPLITSYRPDVPPEIASLIMRGLELNPSLRPSSTNEILAVLSKFMNVKAT